MQNISYSLDRRTLLGAVLAATAGATVVPAQGQTDPLPSWNDGPAKTSITDFVRRVTAQGGSDFVPPAERIATFDNDGTLWSNSPCMSSSPSCSIA